LFVIYSASSLKPASSAGGLLDLWGWRSVNLTVLPFLAIALIAVARVCNRAPQGQLKTPYRESRPHERADSVRCQYRFADGTSAKTARSRL